MSWKTSMQLALSLAVIMGGMTQAQDTPAPGAAASSDDPYLWLEDIHGTRAMDWVKAQNAITQKHFADNPAFAHTRDRILEVLDSDARIPYVERRGDYLYNFWQDKAHPRGLWRRTTLEEYRKSEPKWDVLLDIDALNKAEGKRWVFKGSDCLKPDYKRCLLNLSPGGQDAGELDRRGPHLRGHRFRAGLDDHFELSAHREGMEAWDAAQHRHHGVRRQDGRSCRQRQSRPHTGFRA
jgi:prolyl oligopeptidase